VPLRLSSKPKTWNRDDQGHNRERQKPQDWMWIQYKRAQAGGPQPTRPEPLSVMAKRLGLFRES